MKIVVIADFLFFVKNWEIYFVERIFYYFWYPMITFSRKSTHNTNIPRIQFNSCWFYTLFLPPNQKNTRQAQTKGNYRIFLVRLTIIEMSSHSLTIIIIINNNTLRRIFFHFQYPYSISGQFDHFFVDFWIIFKIASIIPVIMIPQIAPPNFFIKKILILVLYDINIFIVASIVLMQGVFLLLVLLFVYV